MSKKNILIFSGLVCLISLLPSFTSIGSIFCNESIDCFNVLRHSLDSLDIFFALFLLSLLSLPFRNEIFKIWRWFAVGWTIVSVVYAYQTPDSYSGFFSGGPWLTSLYMSAWFVGISIAIFIIASLYYRSKTLK